MPQCWEVCSGAYAVFWQQLLSSSRFSSAFFFGAQIPKRSLRRNSESQSKAEVLTEQKRGIEGEDKVGEEPQEEAG